MNYRFIGKSDLKVSVIGLGCMSLGTDISKVASIIDKALELGVNYLDTADLYDFGLNEEFVGKALEHKREKVILATKVGNRFEAGKEGWNWDPSKAYIKEAVKKSIQRLGTNYIDLYQLHGGTIQDNIDETIDAFEELKTEGVIRHYGISSIRPNVIRQYVKKSSIISVMMQYSLLDRRPEEEIVELLANNNVSIIARGPLAKGLLTDKWSQKVTEKGYLHLSQDEVVQSLERLQNQVANRPLQEYAIQYCLHEPTVAAVIPGASTIEQIENNVKAALSPPLTEQEIIKIRECINSNQYAEHR